MHRRLRAAVEAARAQAAAGSSEVVRAVERGALEIDEQLIAKFREQFAFLWSGPATPAAT